MKTHDPTKKNENDMKTKGTNMNQDPRLHMGTFCLIGNFIFEAFHSCFLQLYVLSLTVFVALSARLFKRRKVFLMLVLGIENVIKHRKNIKAPL